ncbi:unnamed protein product, partial [marine sediment metagenome]
MPPNEKKGVLPALEQDGIKTREQEPAWPGLILFSPCNDLP